MHVQKVRVKGQFLQKSEWKQTDGRTRPIALRSPLSDQERAINQSQHKTADQQLAPHRFVINPRTTQNKMLSCCALSQLEILLLRTSGPICDRL